MRYSPKVFFFFSFLLPSLRPGRWLGFSAAPLQHFMLPCQGSNGRAMGFLVGFLVSFYFAFAYGQPVSSGWDEYEAVHLLRHLWSSEMSLTVATYYYFIRKPGCVTSSPGALDCCYCDISRVA